MELKLKKKLKNIIDYKMKEKIIGIIGIPVEKMEVGYIIEY